MVSGTTPAVMFEVDTTEGMESSQPGQLNDPLD
jgi:hypothetical protein